MSHAVNAKAPALSVAMSVYNADAYLALAIESILAQSMPDFEFLILNDGSSDRSKEIIDAYAARDARIRAIHRENKGLIISLNQLVAEAKAPLIARMDADDIVLPERFAKQMAFLNANPDYGVVGSWSQDIDENGDPWCTFGHDHPVTHDEFLHNVVHGGPLLCHPVVMYRRDLVMGLGGYHAAFRHCEDLDLWLRLASITKIANIPERLIRYRHYAGQVSKRHATEQQIGAAIAYEAYFVRAAGREDPTVGLTSLPPVAQLPSLFGDPDIAHRVRARVAQGILHSPVALRDEGFGILLQHVKDGGTQTGLWRTVARLMKLGLPAQALQLFMTLTTARLSRA